MKTKQMYEIENCKNIAEVLTLTKNDWSVIESPLYDQYNNKIETHKAILRSGSGKCLGIVGKDYHPMELNDSFNIFDSLIESERVTLDSLKVFEGGKKVVLTTNLESFEIKENDVIVPKMNIVQSFDGSKSYQIFFTMFRLICKNGLVGTTEKSIMNIRHTVTMPQKVQFAEVALQNAFEYFERMKSTSIEMVKTHIKDSFANMIIEKIVGKSTDENGKIKTRTLNIQNQIFSLYKNGIGNNGESSWDLYNAFTEYTSHHRGNEENRDFSNLLGSGFAINQQAFKLISSAA